MPTTKTRDWGNSRDHGPRPTQAALDTVPGFISVHLRPQILLSVTNCHRMFMEARLAWQQAGTDKYIKEESIRLP